jgi:hypothetical protein
MLMGPPLFKRYQRAAKTAPLTGARNVLRCASTSVAQTRDRTKVRSARRITSVIQLRYSGTLRCASRVLRATLFRATWQTPRWAFSEGPSARWHVQSQTIGRAAIPFTRSSNYRRRGHSEDGIDARRRVTEQHRRQDGLVLGVRPDRYWQRSPNASAFLEYHALRAIVSEATIRDALKPAMSANRAAKAAAADCKQRRYRMT